MNLVPDEVIINVDNFSSFVKSRIDSNVGSCLIVIVEKSKLRMRNGGIMKKEL